MKRHDKVQVTQRQVLRHNTFAQVPLLNASSVVASWREILPPLRDADTRRIPLDVKEPGVYVVEAVSAPLKAYTIVMVSDIGLVTKTSPGQMLVYAAHRHDRRAADRLRRPDDHRPHGRVRRSRPAPTAWR